MSRIARKAWTLLAVVAVGLARLFPGVGRVRAADRFERFTRVNDLSWSHHRADLHRTLRRFRRAVWALWAVNALLAASIVAAVVGVV